MATGFGFIELVFVFGVVLGLGLWELRSIRREVRRGREAQRDKPNDPAKP
jgi:hypothetical protein